MDGGVTIQSSGEERMLPASNVVGLGDGHQPEGFAALWSRFGPHTQCLCLRRQIKAQQVLSPEQRATDKARFSLVRGSEVSWCRAAMATVQF